MGLKRPRDKISRMSGQWELSTAEVQTADGLSELDQPGTEGLCQ